MNNQRSRAVRGPAFALLGLLTLAACQDAGDPVAVPVDDTVLSEATMDVVAQDVERQQDGLAATAQRDRQRDHTRPAVDRVQLAVDLGGVAVDLATEILDREGADDRQRALLEQAGELHRRSVAALDEGDTGLALRLAQQACWTALKAWVAPGGVTREEAEAVQLLARNLLDDAIAEVGDDDGVRGLILRWAVHFYESGAEALEAGQVRGVMALWKSAVFSAYLIW